MDEYIILYYIPWGIKKTLYPAKSGILILIIEDVTSCLRTARAAYPAVETSTFQEPNPLRLSN